MATILDYADMEGFNHCRNSIGQHGTTAFSLQFLAFHSQTTILYTCSSLPQVPNSNNSLIPPGPLVHWPQHFSMFIISLVSSLFPLPNLNFTTHCFNPLHKSSLMEQLSCSCFPLSHSIRQTPSQIKSLFLHYLYTKGVECSWSNILTVLTILLKIHDQKPKIPSS
jgi:hypothetical protein